MASPVESMSSSLETNALPDECKDRWKDLVAVHDLHFGYESVLDNGKSETRSDVLSQWGDESGYLQGHPLVLKHPGTLDPPHLRECLLHSPYRWRVVGRE